MRYRIPLVLFMIMAASALASGLPEPGRPVLLNLSDNHCMPCKLMNKMVDKLQAEYEGRLEAFTINALKERDAAAKYGPKALPTLIFYNRRGEEVMRHTGIMEENAVREILDSLLAE